MKIIFLFLLFAGCALTKSTTKSISTTGSVVTENNPQAQKILYAENCLDLIRADLSKGSGEYLDTLAQLYGFFEVNAKEKFTSNIASYSKEILSLNLGPKELVSFIDSKI